MKSVCFDRADRRANREIKKAVLQKELESKDLLMGQFRYQNILDNNTMFPSKNMVDYGREASWFLPTNRMDGETSNIYNSPFQTPVANRYSSSTDSTSPESYFNTPFQQSLSPEHNRPKSITPKKFESKLYDSQTFSHNVFDSPPNFDRHPSKFNACMIDRGVTGFTPQDSTSTIFDRKDVYEIQNYDQNHIYDIPFQLSHRPIVGRKILGCHSKISANDKLKSDTYFDNSVWQPMTQIPQTSLVQTQELETSQLPYQLFPSNKKSQEYCTPIELSTDFSTHSQHTISPTSSLVQSSYLSHCVSPTSSNICYSDNLSPSNRLQYTETITKNRLQYMEKNSPNDSNRIHYPENMSPTSSKIPYPQFKPPYNPSHLGKTSSLGETGPTKICMFCRKNGETATVYMNHCVKERIGNRYKVTCPILRALVCMTCGASGDEAHTITYCPVLRSCNNGKPLQSTTVTLKSTRIKSDGTKRNKV